MQIIKFNGLGQPDNPEVRDGDIMLLVRDHDVHVVKLVLVPPDEFGPHFSHASNELVLEESARAAIAKAFPEGLARETHHVLECPQSIADQAVFDGL